MNPFEVLEISPGASPEEVKAAYHRLAKKWHPDRFTGAEKVEAENRFRMLAEAFNMLKDQGRRAELESRVPESPKAAQAPAADGSARPVAERTAEDWLQEARGAFESNEPLRALGLIQYSLRLDAGRAEAHALLARILMATEGDKRALVRALESAIRLNPKDADSMLCLSDVLQSLGMHARAARIRESARQIAPRHKAFRREAPKTPPPGASGGGLGDQLKALLGRLFKRG